MQQEVKAASSISRNQEGARKFLSVNYYANLYRTRRSSHLALGGFVDLIQSIFYIAYCRVYKSL